MSDGIVIALKCPLYDEQTLGVKLFSASSTDICFSALGGAAAAFSFFFCSLSRCFVRLLSSLLLVIIVSFAHFYFGLKGKPDHFARDIIEQQLGHLASCSFISHNCVAGLNNIGACNMVVGLHTSLENVWRNLSGVEISDHHTFMPSRTNVYSFADHRRTEIWIATARLNANYLKLRDMNI